jgi:hypothetical protein
MAISRELFGGRVRDKAEKRPLCHMRDWSKSLTQWGHCNIGEPHHISVPESSGWCQKMGWVG